MSDFVQLLLCFLPISFAIGFFHCRRCCFKCRECNDTFDRPDNVNISLNAPCGWEERGESTEVGLQISGGTLLCMQGGVVALLQSAREIPYAYLGAQAKVNASADRIRMYATYNTANDDCNYLEVRGTSMRLCSRVGGSVTDLVTKTITRNTNQVYSCSVCVYEDAGHQYMVGVFNGISLRSEITAYGNRVGLGNGDLSSLGTVFLGCRAELTGGPGELCASCRECGWRCEAGTVPEEFEVYVGKQPGSIGGDSVCEEHFGTYYAQYEASRLETSVICRWSCPVPVAAVRAGEWVKCTDAVGAEVWWWFWGTTDTLYLDDPMLVVEMKDPPDRTYYATQLRVLFTCNPFLTSTRGCYVHLPERPDLFDCVIVTSPYPPPFNTQPWSTDLEFRKLVTGTVGLDCINDLQDIQVDKYNYPFTPGFCSSHPWDVRVTAMPLA